MINSKNCVGTMPMKIVARLSAVLTIAVLGVQLTAMEEVKTKVTLQIVNDGLLPVKCKLVECEQGWASRTYHNLSEVFVVPVGQSAAIDIPAEGRFKRYLYYGSTEEDDEALASYKMVPQQIATESHDVRVFVSGEFAEEALPQYERGLQNLGRHAILRIRNTSLVGVSLCLYEYEKGYTRTTYHARSANHTLMPGEVKELVVAKTSVLPRTIYFEKGEIGRLSPYIEVPQVIAKKEHELQIYYHGPFSKEYLSELERTGQLCALRITNTSAKPIYVKLYEYESGRTIPSYHVRSLLYKVFPDQTREIAVHNRAPLPRRLYFAADKEELRRNFLSYAVVPQQLIGDEDPIEVFYDFPMTREAADHIRHYNRHFPNNTSLRWAYHGIPALCDQEKEFCENRSRVTHSAIRLLLAGCEGREHLADAEKLPTIALCTSGGGFRAMLSSLGFIEGLRRQQLLDTITYTAALSGSTWIQAALLAHGRPEPDALPEVMEKLCLSLEKGLFEPRILNGTLSDTALLLLRNSISHQIKMHPLFKARFLAENGTKSDASLINSYGMRLAEALFPDREDKYSLTFSSLAPVALSGVLPLPILTAITSCEDPGVYDWVEFTPFEAGYLTKTPAYVPLSSLGRDVKKYYRGEVSSIKSPVKSFNEKIRKHLTEESYYKIEPGFNQLLASCGSAFSVTTSEIIAKSGWQRPIEFLELGTQLAASHLLSHRASSTMLSAYNELKDNIRDANLFSGLHLPNFYAPYARSANHTLVPREVTELLVPETSVLPRTIYFDKEEIELLSPYSEVPQVIVEKELELRDAGIHFNLPLIPLFNQNRAIDIIVVVDASSDVNENIGNALKEFRNVAEEFDIPLPKHLAHDQLLHDQLEQMQEEGSMVTVFSEPGKKTVIYIVSACNDAEETLKYNTFKLQYSIEESHELIGFNEELAHKVAPSIISAIADMTEELNN